ncbi:cell wall hydrolase [Sphingomonas hankyongi]|uniref:Cell wall hydrolase n=1 Tax=Sphingomonas hankyongi TaxID=2908209 RepID=A0ABT0S478_9SPHN|nr:cell wall hydrolase [Sphingomonas hankyongi]MCL6730660.1 cell wall hydrolase [Sphingomonas hankyongi]
MSEAMTLSHPLAGLKDRAAQLKLRAAKLWRSHPREAVGFGVLGLAVAVAVGGAAHSTPDVQPAVAPPAPPPMLIRQLAPEKALQVNEQIPIAVGPNPAAAPFVFKGDKTARARALECLTSAVYYEAGQESTDGQRAVAQVVLNRVRHAAFPASVCGVVYEGSTRATGCQFTFTCDGSLYRGPDAAGWRRAYHVAEAALAGSVYAPVGNATHYHANYVVPYWASTLAKNAVVGAHIFYRWAGGWGQSAAFTKNYAGREPNAEALKTAALAAEAATAYQSPSTVAEAVNEIPGAQALPLKPSMRGDKQVAVRFNLVAREASEKVEHKEYVEKFSASDNLRWTLSGDSAASTEQPLGSATSAAGGSAAGATAQR